jgi:hypothetical protein
MSGGAKAAIIGGIAAGVIILAVVIVVVVMMSRGEKGDPAIVNGRGAYSVNLNHGASDFRMIHFTGGRQVWITVTSDFNTDVDLFVWDQRGALIISDTRISKDCDVRFWPPRTGLYRVEVRNLGPGANRSVVRCN